MNLPEKDIHLLIDRLTASQRSFAIYRLPWTDEPVFVMQESEETEKLYDLPSLNGKTGFVIAPFLPSEKHPAALIHADLKACGWEAITRQLHALNITETATDNLPAADAEVAIREESALKQQYETAFNKFIAPLQKGTFQKLVLSRQATQPLPADFSPLSTFVTACNSYPRMMISLCHTPVTGTWIGSTPEIILSGHQDAWQTVALAGTMPMQGETMPTEWSRKNQEEQAFVSDYIRKIIKKFGSKPSEKGPYTARAGQLVHLKTDFHFTLKQTNQLGELLDALHPTPAVCGLPKAEAYEFITQNEGYDRSYYSGIIGWLDPEGDTSLYVNLRCMKIGRSCTTLFAGGGILPSSTAETEWEETQHKMNTMRRIL